MTSERERSFVLFPLGQKRFALAAEVVAELARPDNLQTFPHCTPLLVGVLVRRGRIVPVCDVAQVLLGPEVPPRKFYLIAQHLREGQEQWTAIPVTGECELATLAPAPAEGEHPCYVTGVLQADGEAINVVDLEKLISVEAKT
jgi:chemotaxis signal transduction protein